MLDYYDEIISDDDNNKIEIEESFEKIDDDMIFSKTQRK